MVVQITKVRFSGQVKTHQSIIRYAWVETTSGKAGENDKPSMVEFVDSKKNPVVVGTGTSQVQVGSVHPREGEPYLRTYADSEWTNNLLSLETF